jgi:hypothetical protein
MVGIGRDSGIESVSPRCKRRSSIPPSTRASLDIGGVFSSPAIQERARLHDPHAFVLLQVEKPLVSGDDVGGAPLQGGSEVGSAPARTSLRTLGYVRTRSTSSTTEGETTRPQEDFLLDPTARVEHRTKGVSQLTICGIPQFSLDRDASPVGERQAAPCESDVRGGHLEELAPRRPGSDHSSDSDPIEIEIAPSPDRRASADSGVDDPANCAAWIPARPDERGAHKLPNLSTAAGLERGQVLDRHEPCRRAFEPLECESGLPTEADVRRHCCEIEDGAGQDRTASAADQDDAATLPDTEGAERAEPRLELGTEACESLRRTEVTGGEDALGEHVAGSGVERDGREGARELRREIRFLLSERAASLFGDRMNHVLQRAQRFGNSGRSRAAYARVRQLLERICIADDDRVETPRLRDAEPQLDEPRLHEPLEPRLGHAAGHAARGETAKETSGLEIGSAIRA